MIMNDILLLCRTGKRYIIFYIFFAKSVLVVVSKASEWVDITWFPSTLPWTEKFGIDTRLVSRRYEKEERAWKGKIFFYRIFFLLLRWSLCTLLVNGQTFCYVISAHKRILILGAQKRGIEANLCGDFTKPPFFCKLLLSLWYVPCWSDGFVLININVWKWEYNAHYFLK